MAAIRVDFGALSVRSRGGVSFGIDIYTNRPSVERYEAGGRRVTVYPSENGTAHEFCVIDEDAGAVTIERDVGDSAIEIFEAGAIVESRLLSHVLGRVTDAPRAVCAARSTDDVWLFAQYDETPDAGTLAHWDGVEWTREEVDITSALSRSIAVTDGYVWLSNGESVARRPRAGGDFEVIDTQGEIVSSGDDRIVVARVFDFFPHATLFTDMSTTPEAVHRDAATAVLDGSGALWSASVESDGESRPSTDGVGIDYYPWWAQAIVVDANEAEIAHATIVVPGEETYYDLLRPTLVSAGDEVAVIWHRDVYLLPH